MGAIETGKEIIKLAQQLGSMEIQQKVIELQSQVLELQETVQTLRKENDELKSVEQIDDELVLDDNAYWHKTAPESRQGPFCMTCWDANRKKVRLVVRRDGLMTCKNCSSTFHTQAYDANRKGAGISVIQSRSRRSFM